VSGDRCRWRVVRHDGDGLVRGIIHYHHALDRAARRLAVKQESIDQAAVARPGRTRVCARQRTGFFAPSAPDVRLLEPLQPFDSIEVDRLAGLAELWVDHTDAVPPRTLRHR